jgi:hypothetical protein
LRLTARVISCTPTRSWCSVPGTKAKPILTVGAVSVRVNAEGIPRSVAVASLVSKLRATELEVSNVNLYLIMHEESGDAVKPISVEVGKFAG